MIRDKLTERVEDTVVAALDTEARHTNTNINPPVEEEQAQDNLRGPTPQEAMDSIFDREPVFADTEPTEVAGLGRVVRGAVDSLKDRTLEAERRVRMESAEPEAVREVGDQLLISPADPDEVKRVNEQLGGQYTKGINYPDIFSASGDFDAAQYLSQFKDANEELFEQARRGTIPFSKMLEMAEKRGLDQIVYDLTKRGPGEVLPPEDFLAGMLAYGQLMNQSRKAWTDAFQMPRGEEREAALRRALQISTVHSRVAVNLSGTTSEAARTLQLAGELKRRGIPGVSEEVALFGAKTAQDIEYVGRHYLAITDPNAMVRFLKKGSNARTLDQISEIWINSILSSPVTHAINIAGNASYSALHTLETFVASGIGRLRSGVTGNAERARAREGIAQLEGIRRSLVDGLVMAGKVTMTETPTDLGSKIDVRTRRAIGTTGDVREITQMIREGELGPAAINAFGTYARLGGRALMAEDEFFKAIAGRSELYRQAEIRAGEIYDTTIETGGTVEEARRAAALERANIINDPPQEIRALVTNKARELTFQQDLDGFLGNMQGAMSHPIAKLFVPFFRTPVNIMKAALERSPAGGAFPSVLRQIKSGGREADIALSRITMGSSIMIGFGYASFALDGPDKSMVIIGNGPQDRDARRAMMRQGFQPYSINIRQEDGTYKSITYSRFDPLSGMLAMAADFAYYAQYETDQNVLDSLAMAASVSIAQYLTEMPLLQGVSELQSAFMQPNPADKFEAILGVLGQKGTEAVMSIAPGTGAFTAGLARVEDPTARSFMLPPEGLVGEDPTQLPSAFRGFYTALQRAKARNPLFNQDLPPRLNEWGEEMKVGEGVWWEFISPVRIRDAQFSAIDEELVSLGDGISRTPRKIDGVLLNAEQYNEWITITNQMDQFGRLPDHPEYDSSSTLLLDLERWIMTPEYQELPTKADKLRTIKNLVSERRSAARKILLNRNADLRLKVNSVQ